MNIWESVLVALEGLVANKMRAFLTMLGVIIGVGAVITVLALGNGAREQMMQRIQQMGTNVLFVFANRSRTAGVNNVRLELEDVDALIKECPNVEMAAPEVQGSVQMKFQNQTVTTSVIGTTPDYIDIRNYQIQDGRMFNADEVKSYRKVAVIGPTAASNLFGESSPVGQTIRVRGISFQIIGLMKSKGAASSFNDPDDQIMIPVTTGMRRVLGTTRIGSISIRAVSMKVMDAASEEAITVLKRRHKVAPENTESLMVRNQAEAMEMADASNRVFTLLLAGIAIVSLLVGGIGIMNIMLVSVTERTREIGIRMALGARRRDIQAQFLIEALVLSLCGGAIGVLIGVSSSLIVNMIPGWHTAISIPSIGLSFGFAAIVGIFFGYYPARKASMLRPIDALRYE